jgi:hypothetical protein
MRSWILRCVNWVASIWPLSNSIFLPTLVGLQTTKDPRELRENRRDEIFWKIPSMQVWIHLFLLWLVLDLAQDACRSRLECTKGLGSLEFWISKQWDSNSISKGNSQDYPLKWKGLVFGIKVGAKESPILSIRCSIYSWITCYLHLTIEFPKLEMSDACVHGRVHAHEIIPFDP